jgi:hypothetical protein
VLAQCRAFRLHCRGKLTFLEGTLATSLPPLSRLSRLDHAPDLCRVELPGAPGLQGSPLLSGDVPRAKALPPQLLGDLAQRQALIAEPDRLGDHGLLGFVLDQRLPVQPELVAVRGVAARLLALLPLGERLGDPIVVPLMQIDVRLAELTLTCKVSARSRYPTTLMNMAELPAV